MSELASRPTEIAAAFFCDFDNLFHALFDGASERDHKRALEESLGLLTHLRDQLRDKGTTMVLGRAYSAFDEQPGSDAAHTLSLIGYEPQYVVHPKGRRSADLQLSIDLLEVLLSRSDIQRFVIIGGEQDLIPIARKVLEARREILIVAPADVTSGDLIDRVGPERFLDAAGLITSAEATPEVGDSEEPVGEPERVAEEPKVRTVAAPPRGARVLGHTTLPKSTWAPRSDQDALSPERQVRCLKLLLSLADRFASNEGRPEIWLSPFLKNEMAEHFPDLTHPQRRRLVNLLKEQGKIVIEERQSQTGPYPYSVVLVNREHPAIDELRV